jgi:hypothetical protein
MGKERVTALKRKPLRAKPSRTTLRRKADRLWSKVILSRGKCEVCGKKATNPHHFIGRKNLTLRHDPRNGIALCYTHHVGGKQSAHQDPQWICAWMMEHRPDDYNYLWEKKEELSTTIDYTQVITNLERKLKEER